MIDLIFLQTAVETPDFSGVYKFIFWFVACIMIGFLGTYRRIGGIPAFLFSLFLTPIIGLVITLFSRTKKSLEDEQKLIHTQNNQQTDVVKQNISTAISKSENLQKIKDLLDSNIISAVEYENMRKKIDSDSRQLTDE